MRPSPRGFHVAFPKWPRSALNWPSFVDGTSSRFGIEEDAIPVGILNQTGQFANLAGELAFELFLLVGHADRSRESHDFLRRDPHIAFARAATAIPALRAFKGKPLGVPRTFVGWIVLDCFVFHDLS